MVTSISYVGFPHIFEEVAAQCDFNTQCKLRLLCSATKEYIDRTHCWLFTAYLRLLGPVDDTGPNTIPQQATVWLCYRDDYPTMPAMYIPERSDDGRKRHEQELQHSLKIISRYPTYQVSLDFELLLWETTFQRCADYEHYARPLQLLETASRVRLLHCHAGYTDSLKRLRQPAESTCPMIPPRVKTLIISLDEDLCLCQSRISHSAETLYLSLFRNLIECEWGDDDVSSVCSLSLDLFKPCVQHLYFEACYTLDVSDYLKAISSKPRHPNLTVTVVPSYTSSDQESRKKTDRKFQKAAKEWPAVLGLPVTLGKYDEVWPAVWKY